jgi:hypothetical protein
MNIKDYREKELKAFVIANILVLFYLTGIITFDGIVENDSYMQLFITIINSGLFSSIIYAMVMVLDSIISDKIKKIIIFWWMPMPGETIFSNIRINTKDNRFTVEEATTAYREIYDNMPLGKDKKKNRRNYENSKWYGLLCQHESEIKVMVIHRDFLMCRDMAVSAIMMILVYLGLSVPMQLIIFDRKAIIYLFVMYMVCMVASRVKSKRFVKTVIACDLHPKKDKSKS